MISPTKPQLPRAPTQNPSFLRNRPRHPPLFPPVNLSTRTAQPKASSFLALDYQDYLHLLLLLTTQARLKWDQNAQPCPYNNKLRLLLPHSSHDSLHQGPQHGGTSGHFHFNLFDTAFSDHGFPEAR